MLYKQESEAAINADNANQPTETSHINAEANTSINTFTFDMMANYAEATVDIPAPTAEQYEIDTEMHDYMQEVTPSIDVDILSWWSERAVKFPALSLLARFIFAIPASSAAPGNVVSEKRTRLSTTTVEDILICNSNRDLIDNEIRTE